MSAGLNGERLLSQGNLRLARVAILSDQVTGESREMEIGHFLHRALTSDDRFARKAMVRIVTRLPARGYGLGDCLLEATPVAIAQQRLEVAGAPILRAVLVDGLRLLEALAFGWRANGYREILFNHKGNISPQPPSQSRKKSISFSDETRLRPHHNRCRVAIDAPQDGCGRHSAADSTDSSPGGSGKRSLRSLPMALSHAQNHRQSKFAAVTRTRMKTNSHVQCPIAQVLPWDRCHRIPAAPPKIGHPH